MRVLREVVDFVAGDDPLSAVGVVAALGLTALLSSPWPLPAGVLLVLARGLGREVGPWRRRRSG